jgi:hypothetical protein
MDDNSGNQKSKNEYRSFLLRLWRVLRNGKRIWLVGLEDPHTGKRKSFSSLDELISYLKEQIHNNVN